VCRQSYFKVSPTSLQYLISASKAHFLFNISYLPRRNQLRFTDDCLIKTQFHGIAWSTIALHHTDPLNVIPNECDFEKGASGSPLLLEASVRPVVVGIQSGHYSRKLISNPRSKDNNSILLFNYAVGAKHSPSRLIYCPRNPYPHLKHSCGKYKLCSRKLAT